MKNHRISHRIIIAIISISKGLAGISVSFLLSILLLWTFFNVIKPLNIIFSIPLVLIILSSFGLGVYIIYIGIFDVFYSRTHCPFCKYPIKIVNSDIVLKCEKCGKEIKFADEYNLSSKNKLDRIMQNFRKKRKKKKK